MSIPRCSSLARLALSASALAALAASPAMAFHRGPASSVAAPAEEQMTDRLIVKYKNATSPASVPSVATLNGARIAGNRQGVQVSHLRRSALGSDILKLNRRLPLDQVRILAKDLKAGDSNVEYAEPDRILHPMMTPSDALYAQQWDFFDATAGVNLPTAWNKSTGRGVVVAVLDTGVRPHADLAANLLPGYDFIVDTMVSNDGNGRDADASDPGDATTAGLCFSGSLASNSSWHGTHVSGTIAAVTNNGSGVAGVAYEAKVLPVRVLGRCGGYTSDIADGIVWASGGTVTNVPANPTPARVINLSLSGSGACDTTSQNAINYARSRGTVVVVAAGNGNADASQSSPASCAGAITVAATGKGGGKASYSNFGAVVSIAAPGGDGSDGILSTLNAGTTSPGADSYASYLGTSMATSHVSGVVALMLSMNPALTPDEVLTRLQSSARAFPATCSECGAGIVDATAAVDAAAVGRSTVVTEVEPNNSMGTAQVIGAIPATVKGFMATTTDLDYYKVTVPAGGQVTATLISNALSDCDLYVFNASGRLVAFSTQGGVGESDTATISNTETVATVAYVLVRRYGGGTGSVKGTYTLSLTN
ncbi:MAG: S8 family peptidase [Burkholderiales bacterium]|nr:S8 family peptidase [Burkholderiales bacterium]